MMKTALAIRHVAFEDLGLVADALAGAGYRAEYREAGVDPLEADELVGADLLVVLGGPIGVYEEDAYPFLADEVAAVAARLQRRRPTLGICLGAQIMAKASGQRVYPSGLKELGWAPVSLTAAGRASVLAALEGLSVLHWHGDTFDLPPGALHLARTEAVANQAFTIDDFALGLQFHIEAPAGQLERWYIGHAGEIAATPGVDVPTLRRQAAQHAALTAVVARRIFADWLARLPNGLVAG
jgi:GMP synthase (glutamine-hydrolysing)